MALSGHDAIAAKRVGLETEIRNQNGTLANVYRLGILVSLAEGQTTSPDFAKGVGFAHSGLLEAQQLVQKHLTAAKLDVAPMTVALNMTQNFGHGRANTHNAVLHLRTTYRNSVLVSPLP